MKLYYSPGACSLAVHITLREADLPFELVRVDLKEHKTATGEDFYAINSKGYVPYLKLDSNEGLSEGVVINQYLADRVPGKQLLPAQGTMERYHALEWMNYIATELHKSFGPLFMPNFPEELRENAKKQLTRKFTWINQLLADKQYLMGKDFTIVDAYLFTVARWAYGLKVPIEGLQNFKVYFDRVHNRPCVQEAMQAEGLRK